MRAAVYHKYGPPSVVHIEQVAKPQPGANDVLVMVHATTVSSGDWRMRSLQLPWGFGWMGPLIFGIGGPRGSGILGTELSGVVEAVGANVTAFQPGDAVFAFTGAAGGAHAEYVVVAAIDGMIAKVPENVTMEDAAAICFGGTTALHNLVRCILACTVRWPLTRRQQPLQRERPR